MPCHTEQSTATLPQLSLNSLPLHWPEPAGLSTPPPCRIPAAVPFLWEEEPGRPRKESILSKTSQKPHAVRSLELPPRMVAEEIKTKSAKKNVTSPSSVLDVCYSISRLRSFSRRYSFNTGSERSLCGMGVRNARKCDIIWFHKEKRESFYTSSCGYAESKESSVKITRLKRHRSFIDVSMHTTSHLLLGINKSLRQVIPWRRT